MDEKAKSVIKALIRASLGLVHARSHALHCQFQRCTCGSVEEVAEAITEFCRAEAAAEELLNGKDMEGPQLAGCADLGSHVER